MEGFGEAGASGEAGKAADLGTVDGRAGFAEARKPHGPDRVCNLMRSN